MRGAAGEERTAIRGVAGEKDTGEGERAVGEGEHLRVVRAAPRVLLEPPLEGEGLQVGQHRVVGVLAREGGEPGLGVAEGAVVDEVEGRAGGRVRGAA